MKKTYENAVLIGRFQPFTNEHERLLTFAHSIANRVIIGLGSINRARDLHNPWTWQERRTMINAAYSNNFQQYVPLADYLYDDPRWLSETQQRINLEESKGPTAIVGSFTDDTSWYLNAFPEWKLEQVSVNSNIHATDVRESYFGIGNMKLWQESVPEAVKLWLYKWSTKTEYAVIAAEMQWLTEYRKLWANVPYPVTFITTDAIVHKSGHVLMVRRRGQPGNGLWALPGGFLQKGKRIVDSALSELKEETRINLPIDEIRRSVKAIRAFDYPDRSIRGRTITHGVFIDLGLTGPLPAVKGGDDAASAHWIRLGDLDGMENEIFEDHYDLIRTWL